MEAKIIKYKGQAVYYVDSIPCVFKKVHDNWAEVEVINTEDYSGKKAFVAAVKGYVAHGETIREAFKDAEYKHRESQSFEDIKNDFLKRYKEKGKLTVKELYEWHGLLTGSCRFGRSQFQEEHNLKDSDELTLKEFIELTEAAFGGDRIKSLKG